MMTGVLSWISSGVAAFIVGRLLPFGRTRQWLVELLAATIFAFAAGLAATALDFGGLRVIDLRAVAFTTAVAFGAVGLLRLSAAAFHRLTSGRRSN